MDRWYAWRAALRIARRDAWRNKGRSALIAIMVALPVFAVTAVDVLWKSSDLDPRDVATVQLGRDAQARITSGGDGGKVTQAITGDSYGNEGTDEPVGPEGMAARARRLLPPGDQLVPDTEFTYGRVIRIGDRSVTSGVRELDYTHRGLEGLVEQRAGRAPAAAGEVVASTTFADHYRVGVGDRLEYKAPGSRKPVPLTVVGVVAGWSVLGDLELIGHEGTFAGGPGAGGEAAPAGNTPPTISWLVVGPEPISWDQVLRFNDAGLAVTSRAVLDDPPPRSQVPYEQEQFDGSTATTTAVGIGIVAVGLILLQIALLAGPAIAVGARRNQRGLAIVAAGGGERRHLRSIVLATSGVIGLTGCAVAAVAGVAAGWAGVLAARRWGAAAIPRVDVPLLEIAGLVLLGTLTAVAASLVPARQAARMNVVDALTGRRGQVPPRLRVPVTGLLVAAAGAGLAFFGASRHQALVTVVGLALGEIGLVVATGALVALAARLARRMPLPARFALRDAARQRGRTAPAVAAVMAAIAGSTAALLYVASQDRADERQYQPSSAPGVVTVGLDAENGGPAEIESRLRRALPVGTVATLRTADAEPGSGLQAFASPLLRPDLECPVDVDEGQVLTAEERATSERDPRCTSPFWPTGAGVYPVPGNGSSAMVDDDGSTLRAVTGVADPAAAAALRAGRVVVFDEQYLGPRGTVRISVDTVTMNGSSAESRPKVVTLPATLVEQRPRVGGVVLPSKLVPRLGLETVFAGYVASTTRMPTGDEEDRAAASLEDVGGYVSIERGYVSQYGIGLLALVAGALVITLGGTFTAVGLAAAEGRADHATLSAVGASPGLRRRLAASQAGVIAGLGAALGLASGFLAGWALVRLQQPMEGGVAYMGNGVTGIETSAGTHWALTVPWLHLAGVGIVVPLLTVAVGYLTTRSRLQLVRRLGQ